MAKQVAVPKTLGACVDKAYRLRQERLAAQKIVDELKAQEKTLIDHLILNIAKEKGAGMKGKTANASVSTQSIARVTDWERLHKHIIKTKNFGLLQRRMNDAHCRELWEEKKTIPGVEPFNVIKVSLTKVR